MLKIYKVQSGFSLIELVLALVMISIMVPSCMAVFVQVFQHKHIAERRILAVNLAQGVLEHTLQKRFSNIRAIPETEYSCRNLGEKEAEICAPCSSNDPNEFCDTTLKDYFYEVQVHQAVSGDLDAAGAPITACRDGGDYCRVEVRVTNAAIPPVRLTGLATDRR